ncbi:response regulator transcription factor [Paenibacillus sacheonensis]|uniref:Response regulator n=1 Tax=Paenibacillus sacheonensis TaxID=742054 RepID=A0A7X4YT75_9BACL|nr:response regulator [Paenibacillus sacheonensis]MBM7568429.1 two-component system response regulator YesN [Paenibacillus sacheonensis]NBC72127.1 response regulator [Paenibacillus sacheonensis]
MYRLLIVDDERFTVDGLYEMIEEIADLELDLYRAYAPEEALEWLARTKIDIVLSDVRMPGMTGLELQKRIAAQWPRCKIIFLTGIHQLETAQHAIRSGSIDYILKTEGDEAIERSIRKAVAALDAETASEGFLLQARLRMSEAMPLLHRDWLQSVLELQAPAVTDEKLAELHIPLKSGSLLIPLIGRIDWPEAAGYRDRALMYAVQNIAAEYYAPLAFFSVSLDMHHFVCLVQPHAEENGSDAAEAEGSEAWAQTQSFVQGTMESIQHTCERLLKLSVSLVCCVQPVAWTALSGVYESMKKRLIVGLGSRDRMLLLWNPGEEGEKPAEPLPMPPLRVLSSNLERLLEEGSEEEFEEAVRQYTSLPDRYADFAIVYYGIASLLLGQLTQGQSESGEEDIGAIDSLMNLTAHQSREAALQLLLRTAAGIYAKRKSLQTERTHQLISKLHQYIRAHLGGDLSLTRLSEIVYLNPAYLSVLYKQQTGGNLSEYIAEARIEKAKELLTTTSLKIHEIAEQIGFETAGYFNRFFKKRLHLTPQEFRFRE